MKIDLNKNINSFVEKLSNMNYLENSMFNSEIYLLYSIAKQMKLNMVIESGLDNGGSTEKLLNLIEFQYIGIDINPNCSFISSNRYKNYSNFEFNNGNSIEILPTLVEKNKDKNILIIIDGPKSREAIELKNKLLNYDHVKIIAVHDTYDGLENENIDRVFETINNTEYNNKYYKLLNNLGNITVFNKKNNDSSRTYFEHYPTGPGISIYSKLNMQFLI